MVVKIEGRRRWRRGHRSYHGSHKKWRGGGSRGGRGKAGMHKHKWSYTVKYEPEHFGKRGFKSRKKERKTINLIEIERIAKENKLKEIDLNKLGYEKVLGRGKISIPITIIGKNFSKKAEIKILEAGGKVIKNEG